MATFQDIQDLITKSLTEFDRGIPALQRDLLENVIDELRSLDLATDGTIETSVKNIQLFGKIKGQLNNLVLNDDYLGHVQDFVNAFTQVQQLQNAYWVSVESTFKPTALLDEIKNQSIDTTLDSLTESGVSANISDQIASVLQTNIGSGGSMRQLQSQLRDLLTEGNSSVGLLRRYTSQITTDAINQFSANYTKIISDDLGYEWYGYRGSDILTTRPFCWALTALRYFHQSQIPALLAATNLYYIDPKTNQRTKVPLYAKTGLPQGMPAGENPINFYVLRGGYNCGHQIGPVSLLIVPPETQAEIYATPAYKSWAIANPNSQSAKKNSVGS